MKFLIRQSISTIIIKNSRSIFTSSTVFSNLSKLRRKTGYPLSSCKAALAKFNDDVDLVIIILKFSFFKPTEVSILKNLRQTNGWMTRLKKKAGLKLKN